jgi:hypothetical protein
MTIEVLLGVLTLAVITLIGVICAKDFTPKPPDVTMEVGPQRVEGDFTTVLPVPLAAQTCSHEWETVVQEKISAPHEQKVVAVLKCDKCGFIDKTVETTSEPPPPPKPIEPRGECRHNWKVEKAVTLDSAYEQIVQAIKSKTSNSWHTRGNTSGKKEVKIELPDPNTASAWMFQKSYLKTRVCSKCGEIHNIVAKNFELEGVSDDSNSPKKKAKEA